MRTGESGERQVDVVAVAARRDMLGGPDAGARAAAGLRPVGIDLSAFGMIRALAGESYSPRRARATRGRRRARPPRDEQGTAPASRRTRLRAAAEQDEQSPARLYCNLGDVTNLAVARGSDLPVHPDLAVRRRGDRAEARRAPRAHPGACPPVAGPRRPRAAAGGDRGRRRDGFGRPRRPRRGRRAPGRRAPALARVLRGPGGRGAGRRQSSSAARGPRFRGSSRASSATSASGSRSAARAHLLSSTTRPRLA